MRTSKWFVDASAEILFTYDARVLSDLTYFGQREISLANFGEKFPWSQNQDNEVCTMHKDTWCDSSRIKLHSSTKLSKHGPVAFSEMEI